MNRIKLIFAVKTFLKKVLSKTRCIIAVLLMAITPFVFAQEGRKVAVLYFTDHSNFDRSSGCGCISLGPLNFLFGSGHQKERWDIGPGFRDLMNEDLKSKGYNVIDPRHVDNIIKETGIDNPALLADKLDADIMVAGDIKKFEQHRNRVTSQGYTVASGGMSGSEQIADMTLLGGIGGFYYSSTVKSLVRIYDNSGEELDNVEVNSKKDLKDFMVGMGPLAKKYKGGESVEENKDQQPIVDYNELDKMKFGTDEFRSRTLFGMATMDVINQIADRIGEYAQPTVVPKVQGKIIYVGDGKHLKENQVYIGLGTGDGLANGNKFMVYKDDLIITDPDSGKEIKRIIGEKVGIITVWKIEADHLSIAEIVEGIGKIEKGDVVKPE